MNTKIQKGILLLATILWPFLFAGICGVVTGQGGSLEDGSVSLENHIEGFRYGVSYLVTTFFAPILSIGEIAGNPALWTPAGLILALALCAGLDKILIWKSNALRGQVISLVALAMLTLACAISMPKAQENPLMMSKALLAMTGLSAIMFVPEVFVISGMLGQRSVATRSVFTINMVLALSLWLTISLRSFST